MKRSLLLLPFVLAACGEIPVGPEGEMRAATNAVSSGAGNKLQCFDGTTDTEQNPGYGPYGGTCTLTGNGAQLSNDVNSYAGVYVLNTNVGGKALKTINKLSFTYSGSAPTGGSPRFSIPIDTDGDGDTDGYLFADAIGCTNGDATGGTVDLINDPTCTMYLGSSVYANWAEFVATGYTISGDIPFVIADQPGSYLITNVQIGRSGAK